MVNFRSFSVFIGMCILNACSSFESDSLAMTSHPIRVGSAEKSIWEQPKADKSTSVNYNRKHIDPNCFDKFARPHGDKWSDLPQRTAWEAQNSHCRQVN